MAESSPAPAVNATVKGGDDSHHNRSATDTSSLPTRKQKRHRVDSSAHAKLPKPKRVGNFKSYYAYRLGQQSQGELESDPRLSVLDKAWFVGHRGLDIGCNSGEFTIAIAKIMEPAFLLGIDVDAQLISRARANLREVIQQKHIQQAFEGMAGQSSEADSSSAVDMVDSKEAMTDDHSQKTSVDEPGEGDKGTAADTFVPLSFRLWKAPTQGKSSVPRSVGKMSAGTEFPLNIVFKRENAVSDTHAGGNYQFITCFSVTKWIHLMHGDEGLKTLFKRIFDLLEPGGRFIFEPQPWKSYHKRKFTSEITAANYDKIQLRPKDFPSFLTESVGFRSCSFLQVCQTSSKGFRRPLYVAEK